jgi:3-deoxy-manno-octulosonate cytidylyltransferase (CMP-KDO synthetase)
MIIWVAELSAKAVSKENVYIATDDERISKVVVEAGFNVVITSSQCLTGTDRLAEAATKIKADIYINVQGDEPMVDPKDISKIIRTKELYYNEIINGYSLMSSNEDYTSANTPKVVFTEEKIMAYMSRKAIPGFKDNGCKPEQYYKQVCIYAFNLNELNDYIGFGRKSTLEEIEDIEILRFLELGKRIRMVKTNPGSLAIDVPEDVVKVEKKLKNLFYD